MSTGKEIDAITGSWLAGVFQEYQPSHVGVLAVLPTFLFVHRLAATLPLEAGRHASPSDINEYLPACCGDRQ